MRVHHLALRCAELERVARFYRELLGLAERKRHYTEQGALRAVWLDAGGCVLMLEQRAEDEPAVPEGSLELVAFGAEEKERDALVEKLAREGVMVEARTAYTVYVRDPEGRRVGVSCYRFEG